MTSALVNLSRLLPVMVVVIAIALFLTFAKMKLKGLMPNEVAL
ncbi:hypothetical protein [Tolypothrix sp. FACHB-123]|nr:hypothetical protein [Tolypothrix sp. FACHB-123]